MVDPSVESFSVCRHSTKTAQQPFHPRCVAGDCMYACRLPPLELEWGNEEGCINVRSSSLCEGSSYEWEGRRFHVAEAPKGSWIGHSSVAVGQLRTDFVVEGNSSHVIAEAWLYASGIGYSEYEVNGVKTSEAVLDPAWTDYNARVMYVGHNVTSLVKVGQNAIGIWLGNGWYSQDQWVKPAVSQPAFGPARVSLSLKIIFSSGSSTYVHSNNASWTVRQGPISQNSVYQGEVIDSRLEVADFSRYGGGASSFHHRAEVLPAPAGALRLQVMPPIQIIRCISPLSSTRPLNGVTLIDFGTNSAGFLRLSNVSGARGVTIQARHGETLQPQTNPSWAKYLWTSNLRGAAATDRFILSGGVDTFQPRFTVHGFRYAEVLNLPPHAVVEMCLVSSTAVPKEGTFKSSNAVIERIFNITGKAAGRVF